MGSRMQFADYDECTLCPRQCRKRRNDGEYGFCGCGSALYLAWIGPHFGEEPPISGSRGSGTVFFSGCTLRCRFCQNYQISLQTQGREYSLDQLCESIEHMVLEQGVHNINFVTPDHYAPHIAACCVKLRDRGIRIPFLANVSGYESPKTLEILDPHMQLWLPDYKYADSELARNLSAAPDYSKTALCALEQMLASKGFLSTDDEGIAVSGVLVRHLVLPGNIQNSIDALSSLFVEFGSELPLSLMSQYRPLLRLEAPFDRELHASEFYQVLSHAESLGFTHLFVQYPQEDRVDGFVPDFAEDQPFKGNIK